MHQYPHGFKGKIEAGIFNFIILFLLIQAMTAGFAYAFQPIKIAVIYPLTGHIAKDASLSVWELISLSTKFTKTGELMEG